MIEKVEQIRKNLNKSLKQSDKEGGWNFIARGLMGNPQWSRHFLLWEIYPLIR